MGFLSLTWAMTRLLSTKFDKPSPGPTCRHRRRKRTTPLGMLQTSASLRLLRGQAFRIYQHGKIEDKLGSVKSFAQFRRERQRNNSFRAFLYALKKELSSSGLSKLFPDPEERIDSYATEM